MRTNCNNGAEGKNSNSAQFLSFNSNPEISYLFFSDTATPGLFKLKVNVDLPLKATAEIDTNELLKNERVVQYLKRFDLQTQDYTLLDCTTNLAPLKPTSVKKLCRYEFALYIDWAVFSRSYRHKYLVANKDGNVYDEGFTLTTNNSNGIWQYPEGAYYKLNIDVWDGKDYTVKDLLKIADTSGEIVNFSKEVKDFYTSYTIYLTPYIECLPLENVRLINRQERLINGIKGDVPNMTPTEAEIWNNKIDALITETYNKLRQ